jgi:site-specific recombinase XerD
MARNIRSNELETRTKRLKLPIARKPIFVKIGPSISLGYRRNQTAGTWVLRLADGKGGSTTSAFGYADDYTDADGQSYLTFFQAQDKAKSLALKADGQIVTPITVKEVTDNYLNVLTAKNAWTAYDSRLRLQKHFLPQFGERTVSSLTKTMLENWLSSLVTKSDDPEDIRRSKDSANRVLSMVKALLNHAMLDQSHNLNDAGWRLVKPFKQVSKPRDIRYTHDEVMKIINSAPDIPTANLIKAAYLTGCRYGEMINALVSSVDLVANTWTVRGKTGQRTIILQQSAVKFFAELTNNRSPDDFLFVREDGRRWKPSDQKGPFKKALSNAGLPTDGSIYALRHTYISMAIEGRVPLTVIARNAGTSVVMIEQTYAKVLNEKERAFIEAGTPSLTAQ